MDKRTRQGLEVVASELDLVLWDRIKKFLPTRLGRQWYRGRRGSKALGSQFVGTFDGVRVVLVDGGQVRLKHYEDFLSGGHHRVYKWIPAKTIWLDGNLSNNELRFVLLHELTEYRLMGSGLKYWSDTSPSAHSIANKVEMKAHEHENKLLVAAANPGCDLPRRSKAVNPGDPSGDEELRRAEREFLADPDADDARDRYFKLLRRRRVGVEEVIQEAIAEHGIRSPVVEALCRPFEDELVREFGDLGELEAIHDTSRIQDFARRHGFTLDVSRLVVDRGHLIGAPGDPNSSLDSRIGEKVGRIQNGWQSLAALSGDEDEQFELEDGFGIYYGTVDYYTAAVFRTPEGYALKLTERRRRGRADEDRFADRSFFYTIAFYTRKGHTP